MKADEKSPTDESVFVPVVEKNKPDDFKLFALDDLPFRLFEHSVDAPKFLNLPDGETKAVTQVVVLNNDLRVSTLFAEFTDTPFDQIYLSNVAFIRQNFSIPGQRSAGLHFEADIKFDPKHGEIHDLISSVLGVPDPTLHVHCGLGLTQSWGKPMKLSSFTIEGTFHDIRATPFEGVMFTDIGVRLLGAEHVSYLPDSTLDLGVAYAYGVFGAMEIALKGWDHPIVLLYEIMKRGDVLQLSAVADVDWEKAFGFEKLTLSDISVEIEFSLKDGLKSAVFGLGAILGYGDTSLAIAGELCMDGTFSIEASITDLTFQTIDDLYFELFDEHLAPLDRPFKVEFATLRISSEGVSFNVQGLMFDTYPIAGGVIFVGRNEVRLSVEAHGGEIAITDEVKLRDPSIEVAFGRSSAGSTGEVVVHGIFAWQGFSLQVSAHLYKVADTPGTQYTLFGRFIHEDPNTKGLRFDAVVPALKDLPALGEITLEDAALIVASREGAVFPFPATVLYKVQKGFFVCAKLDIPLIASATGAENSALTLSAGWSSESGFLIGMQGSDTLKIKLSDDIETEPFETSVVLGPPSSFALSCGLKVHLPEPSETLIFKLKCSVEPTGGQLIIKGSMEGMWANPFGLSPDLKVGNITLGVSVMISGNPTGLEIGGTIQLNESKVGVRLSVSKDPQKTYLRILAKDLGVKDLVEMAQILTGLRLPKAPDVLEFKELLFYACPAPTTIDGKPYPRGIAFHCKMIILKKTATVRAEISTSGVSIAGSMEEFELGGFKVTGQFGSIDGVIELFGQRAALKAEFQLCPSFKFSFYFNLRIDDLFSVIINAAPVAPINEGSHDISQQAYEITGTLESRLLQEIRERVTAKLRQLAEEAEETARQAKKEIERKRQEMHAGIDQVSRSLQQWAAHGPSNQDQVLRQLLDVIRQHLALMPENERRGYASTLEDAVAKVKGTGEVFASRKVSLRQAMSQVQQNIDRGWFGAVVGKVFDLSEGFVPHILSDEFRRDWKECEVAYLQARASLLHAMSKVAPGSLQSELQRMYYAAQGLADAERNNSALVDILEEVVDFHSKLAAALIDFVLNIFHHLVDFSAYMLEKVVDVANEATQGLLRLANGVLTRLLSMLDINYVFLRSRLGGKETFTFDATVKGTISGKPFSLSVHVSFNDFWAMIQALFAEIKKWILENVVP